MIDLEAVFGYPEGDAPVPDVATLPRAHEAENSSSTLDTPAASTEAPDFDVSDWVRRQDCKGRWGWEAPDLPEAARWWARWEFDDLPELVPPDYIGKPAKRNAQGGPQCKETNLPDLEHVGGNRLAQAILGASARCESGQGLAANRGRQRQGEQTI